MFATVQIYKIFNTWGLNLQKHDSNQEDVWDLQRSSNDRFVRFPSSVGIVPIRLFRPRYIDCTLDNFPNSVGILPVIVLSSGVPGFQRNETEDETQYKNGMS